MNVLDGDNPTDTQTIQKGTKPTQELSYKAKIIPKCIVDTIPRLTIIERIQLRCLKVQMWKNVKLQCLINDMS